MRRVWIVLAAAAVLAGCGREQTAAPQVRAPQGTPTMVLTVNWQRLVTERGETCDRCGGTQAELRSAVETLKESLRPLGIEVRYTEGELTAEQCAEDIVQSNRIVMGDRTLEEWLGGGVGQSACASCCSAIGEDVQCRTVCVDGQTYDVVPAELIVRAGLVAASHMMGAPSPGGCCPGTGEPCKTGTACGSGAGGPCKAGRT